MVAVGLVALAAGACASAATTNGLEKGGVQVAVEK
jgi:hypothetical protein